MLQHWTCSNDRTYVFSASAGSKLLRQISCIQWPSHELSCFVYLVLQPWATLFNVFICCNRWRVQVTEKCYIASIDISCYNVHWFMFGFVVCLGLCDMLFYVINFIYSVHTCYFVMCQMRNLVPGIHTGRLVISSNLWKISESLALVISKVKTIL